MFGSSILDIAIGLCFVYLLLSLVCSTARELLEGWMRHRAADLKDAIDQLLDNATTGLSDQVYGHGLIKALSTAGARPSYLPSQTFALALMDSICPGTVAAAGGAVNSLISTAPARAPVTGLREGAGTVTSAPLRAAILALIDSAGQDATAIRSNIETWFNASMERVTGRYKRRTQNIILALGVLIVCALNVDSIGLAQSLSNDAAMRASLVAAAQQYISTGAPGAPAQSQTADQKIKDVLSDIHTLGIPIGWQHAPSTWDISGWIEKVLGLLVTSL